MASSGTLPSGVLPSGTLLPGTLLPGVLPPMASTVRLAIRPASGQVSTDR
jgi:hypothetical protein